MRRIVFLVVAAHALTLTCRLLAGVERREDLLSITSIPRLEAQLAVVSGRACSR